MQLSSLTAPVATMLGAIVGATAGIAGALLATWMQLRLERRRSAQSRQDAIAKEFSAAIQQLTITMASSLHSMCWLTWLAAKRGDRVIQARLNEYDAEQHKLLPQMLGYMSTVAAIDIDAYRLLVPHVNEIFRLDGRIGEIGLSLDLDPSDTTRELGTWYSTLVELEHQLPQIVGNIVSDRIRGLSASIERLKVSRSLPVDESLMAKSDAEASV